MSKISIEDAVKITREYKRRMNGYFEDMKGIEQKNVVEITEDKSYTNVSSVSQAQMEFHLDNW